MSLPCIHIAQIKQEIAQMTHDGHIVDFQEINSINAVEYELQKYLHYQDIKDERSKIQTIQE